MTPYILAYVFYFSVLIMGVRSHYLRWWFLVASVPFVALVFLRGLVGVDMPVYEQSIDLIRDAGTYTFNFEPLFEYLVLYVANQIDDPATVLLVFSALTTTLLYLGSFRIERQPYLIAFFLIPYFYLDMTMNGLRMGLAFSIILYGSHYIANEKRLPYVFLALAAALIHISSAFLAVFLVVLLERRWSALFWAVAISLLSMIYFDTYLIDKFEAYQTISINSASGGLAPLILSILLLVTFYTNKTFSATCKAQLIALGGLSAITYAVTQFTYAGLRFQTLNLFLICLFLVSFGSSKKICINTRTILIIGLIGAVGAGFRLRNFYSEAGEGEAPFAPYHFFWER